MADRGGGMHCLVCGRRRRSYATGHWRALSCTDQWRHPVMKLSRLARNVAYCHAENYGDNEKNLEQKYTYTVLDKKGMSLRLIVQKLWISVSECLWVLGSSSSSKCCAVSFGNIALFMYACTQFLCLQAVANVTEDGQYTHVEEVKRTARCLTT